MLPPPAIRVDATVALITATVPPEVLVLMTWLVLFDRVPRLAIPAWVAATVVVTVEPGTVDATVATTVEDEMDCTKIAVATVAVTVLTETTPPTVVVTVCATVAGTVLTGTVEFGL